MKRLQALSASAGSGKTFALVARYLALLFLGAKPSEILAITFTNKAAGEMRERLLASLADPEEAMVAEVARESGLGVEEIERKRPGVYARFLVSDVRVMTIDAFVHQVLRRFCWYAGLGSDFTIAPTPKEEFFREYLESLDAARYAELVDFARFESRRGGEIADFFELLYEKEKELPPLPSEEPPYDEGEVMRWALEIREYILHSDASASAKKAVDFEDLEGFLNKSKSWLGKESLAEYRYFKKVYTPRLDEWFANLKAALADYYGRKERYYLSRIGRLYGGYRRVRKARLRRTGELHFKDVEHFVYDLLRREDFTDFLYFRLDARIGHILFDEFQDTSVTQYRIFEPILEEIAAAGERTFFYVGDVKQSIYRFRGGQKALFGHVARRFGVSVERLVYNYRSRAAIVEFVNRTFPYPEPPQKPVREGGFVRVERGEPLEILEKSLRELLDRGVREREIAVLVHDNREILEVGELIRSRLGRKISTHKRAKVTHQPSAAAIVEMMRMIHAKNLGEPYDLHRLNFLALVGRPYDPAFEPDVPLGRPASMVKGVMERYGLYDEAAMKLLEFAIGHHDLVDFVFALEGYDEELPASELDGIQVLTIHKSKGLEFDHVVVMDRLFQEGGRGGGPIFDYEGIELRALRIPFRGRELVDGDFAAVVEKEKRLEKEDRMNRAYVAFTRARESLFVAAKAQDGWFEFLELEACEIGELAVAPKPPPPAVAESAPPRLRWEDYGRQETAVAPESYEANDFEAIYLGQGVHYLFETEDFDAFLNRFGALCDIERARSLYEAGRNSPEFVALTAGEARHEMPYVHKGKSGVVDLFVDRGDAGVIVDFKTATPHDTGAYRRQLRRYLEALTALMPGKRLEAYLYFLDTLKLERVE